MKRLNFGEFEFLLCLFVKKLTENTIFYYVADKYLGLLQTAFVVCYMVFAPVFGYLGDRHSRKWLLGIGIGTPPPPLSLFKYSTNPNPGEESKYGSIFGPRTIYLPATASYKKMFFPLYLHSYFSKKCICFCFYFLPFCMLLFVNFFFISSSVLFVPFFHIFLLFPFPFHNFPPDRYSPRGMRERGCGDAHTVPTVFPIFSNIPCS
jgi:hypothetical protein